MHTMTRQTPNRPKHLSSSCVSVLPHSLTTRLWVLFFAAFLTLSAVPAYATTWNVNTTVDELDGSCADGDCSLRDAITLANADGSASSGSPHIINIAAGTYTITRAGTDFTTVNGDYDLKNWMTIKGAGQASTFIEGHASKSRVFQKGGGYNVTFEDMTIRNGDATALATKEGGCIYSDQNTLTLNNVTFDNCTAQRGGAVLVGDSTSFLYVTDSTFTNNTATTLNGGGIWVRGQATISSSTFTGNNAVTGGGAVWNNNYSMTIDATGTASSSIFTNNHVSNGYGGAVAHYVSFSDKILTINDALFSGNSASQYGGAVANMTSTSSAKSTTYFTNCTLDNNTAGTWGGASFSRGHINVNKSTITNNTGAARSGALLAWQTITATNSTFSGNNASGTFSETDTGKGGAIYTGTVTVNNSTFYNNTAANAAEHIKATSGTTKNSIFSKSSAAAISYCVGVSSSGYNLQYNGTCFSAGGTDVSSDPLLDALADNGGPTETHALQAGSPAINTGDNGTCETVDQRGESRPVDGTCDMGSYEYTASPPPLTVCASGCGYTSIQAAIDASSNGDTITVKDGTYSENINYNNKLVTVISENGAATTTIQGDGSDAPVVTFNSGETSSAVLDGFTIDNQQSGGNSARGFSISSSSSPLIKNSIIKGNTPSSTANGASFYIDGGGVTIQDSTIGGSVGNANSGARGVAIYQQNSSLPVTISGTTISYNSSSTEGGGLYLVNVTATTVISDSSISNNSAGTHGGGIYNLSSPMTITNTDIDNNSANNDGGGFCLKNESTDVTMTGGSIDGNTAANSGGVNLQVGADFTYTNGSVSGNSATGNNGGGIDIYHDNTQLTLTKVSIKGNKTIQRGGGIYIRTSGSTATLTSCIVSGNSVGSSTWEEGAGIRNVGTLNLTNCTIAGNYASGRGGGLHTTGTATVVNTIFWGNTAGNSNDEIYSTGTTNVTYSDIAGGYSGTGNINIDPALVNLQQATSGSNPTTAGDFHLSGSTPVTVISGGTATGAPSDDIDGDTRNTPPSMGADEGTPPANTAPIGGYTANNVIPTAQVIQATDGTGIITITWKGVDADTNNVTLKNFEYSVDGGSSWNAPTNGDSSVSLSTNWEDNGGAGYTTATSFGSATAHSFTFNTKHADTSGMAGVDQSDVQIRFTLNDATVDSTSPATSESFQVDNVIPTPTITSSSYDPNSNALTITGTDFTSIATATTDIKDFVDWSKFTWDINGDDATTANISFVVGDIDSLTVTDATTLTLVFTSAKATAIEGTTGYGSADGADTLDVTAGFSKDEFGNTATTDGVTDAAITVIIPSYTVTKTADTNDGSCDVGDCSIREAVAAANAGSDTNTITIPAGTYTITLSGSDDLNATGDFDITNPVNIVGAGSGSTIIRAASTLAGAADRIFHDTTSAAVTIEGVTIQYGKITATGGCILTAGNLTLKDSVVDSCTATSNHGGAIYSSSSISLDNTTITNGTAGNSGGALYTTGLTITNGATIQNNYATNYAGGIYNLTSDININGTTLFDNNDTAKSTNDNGGAIWTSGNIVLNDTAGATTFSNNDALNGGAIWMNDSSKTITMKNPTFTANTVSGKGGAIYGYGITVTGGATFENNSSGSAGGAIYNQTADISMDGTLLFNNNDTGKSTDDNGGAVWTSGNIYLNATSGSSTFSNNDALNGGAVYMGNSAKAVTMVNPTFDTNTAVTNGGALFVYGVTITGGLTAQDNSVSGAGGAIYSNSSDNDVSIDGTILCDNNDTAGSTNDHGGAIFSKGNVILNPTAGSATFTNNDAQHGGAIYLEYTTKSLTISNGPTFTNNTATSNGGAIRASNISITGGATFETNSSSNHGGAIFSALGDLTIDGTIMFDGNYNPAIGTTDYGGAIFSNGDVILNPTSGTATFQNSTAYHGGAIFANDFNVSTSAAISFINNTATLNGGAVYATSVTMDNGVTATGNSAAGNGGAFFTKGGSLSNVNFTNNRSTANDGGAIYNITGALTISGTNNIFDSNYSGNASADYGGTIYADADLTISNATFTSNNDGTADAYQGGAIFMNSSTLNLDTVSFANFHATAHAGAVQMKGGTFTDVTFTGNHAGTDDGGAIINNVSPLIINGTSNVFTNNYTDFGSGDYAGTIYSAADLSITNATFTGNDDGVADAQLGGAIYMNTGTTLTLDTVSFANFHAANSGGAILSRSGTFTDVTFTGNHAGVDDGGAIFSASNLVINGTSNIFTGNYTANGTGDYGGTIYSSAGTLSVDNAAFTGDGDGTTDASYGGAIFMNTTSALTVSNSSFKDFYVTNHGGAIYMKAGSITGSTFENNTANGDGAAVFGTGAGISYANSTFSANNAGSDGGAIYQSASCTVTNSTFYNNTATATADAIRGSTCTIKNSIVSKSTASSSLCTGVTSGDYNLQYNGTCFTAQANDKTGDPLLEALAANGGSTETHALLAGSPAIDSGDNTTCAAAPVNNVDQRGTARPYGTNCEIGAYEYDVSVSNNAPFGGFSTVNVIPAAQITQSTDGNGILTINWKAKDLDTENVTLKAFEYSVDGGTSWNAPTNGDSSLSLSTNWTNNGGGGYTSATTLAAATAHSFTFTTKHADTSGLTGIDQNDVQIRFTLNDATDDSASPATSESFQVDNEAPTATFTSGTYDQATRTLTLTGTNFTTIATSGTDVKSYVDWTKFVWDINGDDATTTNVTFVEGDITSLTITDATTLTLIFTSAKATALAGTTGYGDTGGADTFDITAGFSRDSFANVATTDAVADGSITIIVPDLTVCASGCGFTTIQAAIDASTNGDTITVKDGTYSENINFNNKLVTVLSENGAATTTIAGSGSDAPVVTFSSGETSAAVLDGFTINNTSPADQYNGNGIKITNSSAPTIKNCTITGNSMRGSGAGMMIDGGAATIENCTIDSNTSSYEKGAGIYLINGSATTTISDTSISSNSAKYEGKGIYCDNSALTLTNTTINSNSGAEGSGGGLNIINDSDVIITGSSINGNSTRYGANGIRFVGAGGGSLEISNTTINSNTTTLNGKGGGLYLENVGSTITITDTTIDGNAAKDGGGGIYAKTATGSHTMTITNTNITSNTCSEGSGGGIWADDFAGTITITDSTVDGNTGKGSAGGIRINTSGQMNLTNTDITNNNNTGTYSTNHGGGVAVIDASFSITGGSISGNSLVQSGGGVYVSGTSTFTANKTIISGNSSGGDDSGGGFYIDGGTTTLTNCMITGNITGTNYWSSGGGISNSGGTLNVNHCTIAGNWATKRGGGIWAGSGTTTINGSLLWDNTATDANSHDILGTSTVNYSAIKNGSGYTGSNNVTSITGTVFTSPDYASSGNAKTGGDYGIKTDAVEIINTGDPASSVTVDYEGDSRAATINEIGADELPGVGLTAPTSTYSTATYTSTTNTLVLTGTDMDTMASAGTDVKDYVDWSKFVWDINNDGATTADITFASSDFDSATVTDSTTLTLILTASKASSVEDTLGIGYVGGVDTIDITTGFSKNAGGIAATGDANAAVPLTVDTNQFNVNVLGDNVDAAGCTIADCSLREAVNAVNASGSAQTINITIAGTITLSGTVGEDSNAGGDLDISQPTTIIGQGVGSTIISAGVADRLFDFKTGSVGSSISDMTIQNGNATNGGCLLTGVNITIEDSKFTGCSATQNGGAIYSTAGGTFNSIEFSNNNSSIGGGAIWSSTNTLTIGGTGNIFTGNYSGNTGGFVGGSIYSAANLSIDNADFDGRTASTDSDAFQGGAIYVAGNLTLSNSTFDDLESNQGGGAIYMTGGTLENVTFRNNHSNNTLGGAIANKTNLLTIQGTSNIFSGNFCATTLNNTGGSIWSDGALTITNSDFDGRTGSTDSDAYQGGAIYTTGTLTLSNSTFDDLETTTGGGAVYMAGGGTMEDITFRNNHSNTASAGAIASITNPLTIQGTSNIFSGNFCGSALNDHGGTILSTGALTITNSDFDGRTDSTDSDAYRGGAIYVSSGTLTLSNSTFDDFETTTGGGAIYMSGGGTMEDITFRNNHSNSASAGAIANIDNPLTIQGTSNIFSGNFCGSASDDHGGTILSTGALTISNADFDGRPSSTDSDAYRGGAIYVSSGTLTLNNSTFDDFETNVAGGAIYMSGGGTMEDISFNNNHSNTTFGGAVANFDNLLTIQGASNTFTNNNTSAGSSDNGGAIWTSGGLTVTNTTFSDSTAYLGGAIYALGTNTVTVQKSLFTNNSTAGAGTDGGAISTADAGTTLKIANTTFSGNTAVDKGAAVQSGGTTCEIRSSTFYNNDGGGTTGDVIHGPGCTIYGSIVQNTTASTDMCSDGSGGYIASGGYNIQYSSTGTGTCFTNTTGDNTTDPMIDTTLANNGGPTLTHALLNNSPATNTGNNTQCSHTDVNNEDQRGSTRPAGAGCDIGSFEDQTVPANAPPIGGYTVNNVIPSEQVVQATDGSGLITINWKGVDANTHNVSLHTFEYSVDGGSTWGAPTNGDTSAAISTNWTDSDGGGTGYTTATTFGAAAAHSFTFNTKHADATGGINWMNQSDVQIRFMLNDGTDDSASYVTSESFTVNNTTPTPTIVSGAYNSNTNTLVITGTNFTTVATAGTDIKSYVDWTKFSWDINNDGATSPDVSFEEADIVSLTVTDATTLTMVLTTAKEISLEATVGFGTTGNADTLDVTAGFLRDAYGNAPTTDLNSNAPLSVVMPPLTVCASGCGYTMIQPAINASTAGDTITVDDGTYTENLEVVLKNITIESINGAASTIIQSAADDDQVIYGQNSPSLHLKGFTVTGSVNKPGIYWHNNTLTLEDCIISNNTNSGNGGGVAVNVATLIVINTTFTGNQAVEGGAIHLNTGAKATISGSTFTNNHATATGGAIDFNSVNAAETTLDTSTFEGNTSDSSAGALYFNGSAINVTKCDIKNNTAVIGGAVFVNGGASAAPVFTNCLFTGNEASGGNGGVLYGNTGVTPSFINCTIADNTATTAGGALYAHNLSVITVRNSILWGNTAGAGNTAGMGGSVIISDSIYQDVDPFSGNTPTLTNTSTTNPNLTADYKLQDTSTAAIDQANAAYAPDDDIDGDSRPIGLADDIGADETTVSGNSAPIGGYTTNNVIPAAQISQATDGSGIVTINWKGIDLETSNVTLKTFEYSVDDGSSWNAPTNGDSSGSLSSNWTDNDGSGTGYTTATSFGAATEHSFTFDTKHTDLSDLNGVDQNDIQIRFTLNDGTLDSVYPATSESFQVDNLAPTTTITSGSYDQLSKTLIITGTNFTTIATAGTDIKSYMDWTKFVWDINGNNLTTANITFAESDITSLTVTNATTLTLLFTDAKATTIRRTTQYGASGGDDTLDVTAGFSIDSFGNISSTDGVANAPLTITEVASQTFTVTKEEDTRDGTCDADCSLREAIDASNANQAENGIIIPAGTYTLTRTGIGEDFNDTGDLDILESVAIQGAGAGTTIIDGDGADRIFHAKYGLGLNITLNQLTLTNGDADAFFGSAMNVESNSLIIFNSSITNCGDANAGRGGAIYINGGYLMTFASTFSSNQTSNLGGAVCILGGISQISNTTFSNNTSYLDGGAFYSTTDVTIDGSTFTNNTATAGNGGALAAKDTITITQSTFSGNTGKNAGAIILNSDGTLEVKQSAIYGNIANNGSGGGLLSWLGTVNLYNSTISGNTATGAAGGLYAKNCTVKSATFYNNTNAGGWGGGAIHNDQTAPAGQCTVQNTIFNNNTSTCRSSADIISLGNNLDDLNSCGLTETGDQQSTDALLNALADNGGFTFTHSLQLGSPALDAGNNTACSDSPINNVDQISQTRPKDGDGDSTATCDIGAFESDYIPTNSTTAGVATATAASSTTIDYSMPYSDDENTNNTYTVNYKLAAAGSWTNHITNAAHSASPYEGTITSLTPGETYDVQLIYNDDDNVTGDATQLIEDISLPNDVTTAGTATASSASDTSIGFVMPYTDDNDGDNTYTVDYKLSSAGSWTNHVTGAAHVPSPYTGTISGLTTGEAYDIQVTYIDDDGVDGDAVQIIENIVPTLDVTTVCETGGDFTTIQAAINASSDGDTILVCDGTYSENIDFRDTGSSTAKKITLRSENGADTTIIQGATSSTNAAVVTFQDSEHDATTVLDGFTITNQATNLSDSRGIDIKNGAAPKIQNCKVDGNQVSDWYAYGAALRISGTDSGATVDNTTFNNNASGNGAVYCEAGATITMNNSNIENNTAGVDCGGLRINGSTTTATLTGCTVDGNSATNHGAGIYAEAGATLTMTNTSINNNTAGMDGAGLRLKNADTSATLSNCTINENSGKQGGGIYVDGITSLTITDSEINGNTATNTIGGGIRLIAATNTTLNITRTLIQGNQSKQHGAGIYTCTGNTVTLTNSTITGNAAGTSTWEKGGGIANGGNGAGEAGGTLYIYNTTIAGNYAGNGGGLYCNGTETVRNSIIWGNNANSNPNITSGGADIVDSSAIGGGYAGGSNIIDSDPAFVNMQQASLATPTAMDNLGNFHLSAGSPCIDTASTTNAPNNDIDLESRPYDVGGLGDDVDDYDMGSDEWMPGAAPTPVDHYDISHNGIGITCDAEPITITAHDDNHAAFSVQQSTTITITASTGDGQFSSNTGTLIDNGSGVATYTFAPGDSQAIIQYGNSTAGVPITFTVTGPDAVATEGQNSVLTFSDAILRFNTIANQIGGQSASGMTIQAVKTDLSTQACVAAIDADIHTVQLGYECLNPGTCTGSNLVEVQPGSTSFTCGNGTGVTRNNSGSSTASQNVSLTFDASGTATYSMVNCDVGQLRLHAEMTTDPVGANPSAELQGTSNTFIVKPFGFDISVTSPSNPAAADASGGVFTQAGAEFEVEARAVLWEAADDGDTNGVPDSGANLTNNATANNFGQESTAETVSLTHTLVSPAGGNAGTLTNGTISGFSSGTGSNSTTSYDEVGIITLQAAITANNYIGATSGATGSSGNVGRFVPHHFNVTLTNTPEFSGHGCGTFTYMGQEFSFDTEPSYRISAKDINNNTTLNYGGDFWKTPAPTFGVQDQVGGVSDLDGSPTVTPAHSDNGDFDGNSTMTVGATLNYQRSADPRTPFSTAIQLVLSGLEDGDDVCFDQGPNWASASYPADCDSTTSATITGTEQRWGRIHVEPAFGPEDQRLGVNVSTEYFFSNSFKKNDDDFCTEIEIDLTAGTNIDPSDTCVQEKNSGNESGGHGCSTLVTDGFVDPAFKGRFTVKLEAPNIVGDISVSAWADDNPSIFQFDWDGDGSHDENSEASANFGLYRGNDRIINFMEIQR